MLDQGALPQRLLTGPDGVAVDTDRRQVTVGSRVAALTRREFDLLRVLLEDRGRAIGFDELACRAWGHVVAGDRRFIQTAAWRLRRSLAAAGARSVVENVRGIGYRVPDDSGLPPFGRLPVTDRAVALFDPLHPRLRLSRVNDAALELSGYEAEQLTKDDGPVRVLWSPEERAVIDETVRAALEFGTAETCGRDLIMATGETVRVNLRFTSLGPAGDAPLTLAEVVPTYR
jgi:PAS domain-containing protein